MRNVDIEAISGKRQVVVIYSSDGPRMSSVSVHGQNSVGWNVAVGDDVAAVVVPPEFDSLARLVVEVVGQRLVPGA